MDYSLQKALEHLDWEDCDLGSWFGSVAEIEDDGMPGVLIRIVFDSLEQRYEFMRETLIVDVEETDDDT